MSDLIAQYGILGCILGFIVGFYIISFILIEILGVFVRAAQHVKKNGQYILKEPTPFQQKFAKVRYTYECIAGLLCIAYIIYRVVIGLLDKT